MHLSHLIFISLISLPFLEHEKEMLRKEATAYRIELKSERQRAHTAAIETLIAVDKEVHNNDNVRHGPLPLSKEFILNMTPARTKGLYMGRGLSPRHWTWQRDRNGEIISKDSPEGGRGLFISESRETRKSYSKIHQHKHQHSEKVKVWK